MVGDLPLLHRRQWAEQVLYGVDYISTYIHAIIYVHIHTLDVIHTKQIYYIHSAVQGCPIYAVQRDAQTDEVGTRCVCMYVCIYECMYVCMTCTNHELKIYIYIKEIHNTDQINWSQIPFRTCTSTSTRQKLSMLSFLDRYVLCMYE